MNNYFVLKVDELINTFSILSCGYETTFSFTSKNEKEIFVKVSKDDYILAYNNTVKSILKVISKKSSSEITVEKILETSIGIDLENSLKDALLEEGIIEIEENNYNEIVRQLALLNFPLLTDLTIEAQQSITFDSVPKITHILDPLKYDRIDRNKIFFGAPGTGKSYKLNKDKDRLLNIKEDADSSEQYERITFHPDYSYANFVGTYKPIAYKDQDDIKKITYEFVPGPFIRTYIKAVKSARNEEVKPFLLIIEEINRSNVAAVFGDIFQLLDRKDNGESEYSIHASEDLKNYLADPDVLGGQPKDYSEIRIPDNMFIWATMNSADQGVYPMDTAFKRRWSFEYLGVDNNQDIIEDKNFTLPNQEVINWNLLRKSINAKLSALRINEDKLLGPFFISKSILESEDVIFKNAFTNKVLMYLFEDAAKHKKNEIFNIKYQSVDNVFLYSHLCNMFEEVGIDIFNTDIIETYKKLEKAYNQENDGLDTTKKVFNDNEAE